MRKSFLPLALTAMLFTSFSLPTITAFAADSVKTEKVEATQVTPESSQAPAVEAKEEPKVEAAPEDETAFSSFLSKVLETIKNFGGLSTVFKIAAVIALLVASMKVTILNELVWSKLGSAKAFVAPVLGLVAGLLDVAGAGTVTLASVLAYISSGAGALILADLLDAVKGIKGLGPIYIQIIEIIQKSLGPVGSKKPVAGSKAA